MSYTIEWLDDGRVVDIPMVFRDKETALENARALMDAGFVVNRVKGPGFEIGQTEIEAFLQSRRQYARRTRWG
jgi:hypothetical protein